MPEAEPREALQLLLCPAPWHRLGINSVAPVSAEVRGIQRAANGSNVSHSMISPHLSSFRSVAHVFTFSWEVGLVIETCQKQKLHQCSVQREDMNSDTSTGSLCHGKPLMLFLSFVVLSLMRSMILLYVQGDRIETSQLFFGNTSENLKFCLSQ